jgi:uncharacterized protein YndB with AHSA1/START domain
MIESTPSVIEPALVLRRTYPVSRERVYAAWTTPEIAAKFLGPREVTVLDVAMDPRVGGTYSITYRTPDGEEMTVTGIYREVRAPERLAMTWSWVEDDPADRHESWLSIDFTDLGGSTELVLTHERLASPESRDRHQSGWTSIVDELGALLRQSA